MQPSEALGIAAQLAVAIAGFTGVVIALGSGGVRQWPADNRFRLTLLLTTSVFAFAFCLIGLLLLSTGWRTPTIWRWISGFAAGTVIGNGVLVALRFRHQFPKQTRLGTVFVVARQVAICGLLTYNAVALGAFWPFFTFIVMALLLAIVQFVRLLFVNLSDAQN